MIPKSLISAVKAGIAIPFIGAGISRPSGIIAWPEIIKNINQRLINANQGQVNDEYEIPDRYFNNRQKLNEYRKFIEDAVGEEFSPNELHTLLSKIPFKTIVTTNWDELIEQEYRSNNKAVNVIYDDSTATTWSEANSTQIVKIHGTVGQIESIIFGLGSYEKFYNESTGNLMTLLRNLFSSRPLIFLGFSLQDKYLISLLNSIDRLNESFVVLPSSDADDYCNQNITPIFVETCPADPYGVQGFLSELWRNTYTSASSRVDRTNLLVRETNELTSFLGADKTIRCRASIGPLGVPEQNLFNTFGDVDVYNIEKRLLETVVSCVTNIERCKLKIICCASNNSDFAIRKGYSYDGHIARLDAFIKWLNVLGEKVEVVNSNRPSDVNDWIVSNFSLVESRKPASREARLYEFGTLILDKNIIRERVARFDNDFNDLLKPYEDVNTVRHEFINRVQSEIDSFRQRIDK